MKTSLLLCPVDDLDAAVAFYRDALGLPVKFRDGDRYCAIDGGGGLVLGLAAGAERIVDQPCPVFRVEDVERAVAALAAAGAEVLRPVERGPHELRAVLRAPGGGAVVLSAKI